VIPIRFSKNCRGKGNLSFMLKSFDAIHGLVNFNMNLHCMPTSGIDWENQTIIVFLPIVHPINY